jgi:hypothetical protein
LITDDVIRDADPSNKPVKRRIHCKDRKNVRRRPRVENDRRAAGGVSRRSRRASVDELEVDVALHGGNKQRRHSSDDVLLDDGHRNESEEDVLNFLDDEIAKIDLGDEEEEEEEVNDCEEYFVTRHLGYCYDVSDCPYCYYYYWSPLSLYPENAGTDCEKGARKTLIEFLLIRTKVTVT